jgi:LPXTG-motif cell wall-anchored protein
MRRIFTRILTGAAVAGLALTGMAIPSEAGTAPTNSESVFVISVLGPDAQTVLDGLSLEIFDGTVAPGQTGTDITVVAGCVPDEKPGRFTAARATTAELCQLADDDSTYTAGLAGIPAGWHAAGFCYTNQDNFEAIPGDTTFTLGLGEYASCELTVAPVDASMVYSVFVNGLGHAAALDGVEIEVYEDGSLVDPLECSATGPAEVTSEFGPPFTGFGGACDLPSSGPDVQLPEAIVQGGDYQLGLSALPDGYEIDFAYCGPIGIRNIELIEPAVGFSVYNDEFGLPSATCEIYIVGPPTVYVEHVVDGGPADTTDFTTQLFDGTGALAGESSDPSPDFCMGGYILGDRVTEALPPSVVADVCGAIVVPAEVAYSVGAVLPDYGYEATADCSAEPPFLGFLNERIASDLTTVEPPYPQSNASLCVLTATYYEQTITVDVNVDNSAGGTSSDGSDIEVEVYDQDGTLVDSGFDPAPNSASASAEFTLPIGDYTIGVSGPDGYVFTVAITVEENDVTSSAVPVEIIDDPSANLSLTSQQTAAVELLATGQPAPTTTTTVAPTTTAGPTTTAVGAGGLLPATGQSSTTDNLAWWALGLLGAGLLIARASRRPATHTR